MSKYSEKYFEKFKDAIEGNDILQKLTQLYEDIRSEQAFARDMFDERKYPALPESDKFQPEAIAELVKTDGCLTPKATELIKNNPLAQILYAVVWKNGDLCKFGPLLAGLTAEGDDIPIIKNDSYVFYQFGRHLVDRKEPIADQHAIRAMLYYQYRFDRSVLDSQFRRDLQKIYTLKRPTRVLLGKYVNWINTILADTKRDRVKMQHLFDKIAFTLGKHIKQKS